MDAEPYTFFDPDTRTPIGREAALLAAVVAARALLAYLSDLAAARASARAKSDLRTAVIDKTLAVGPIRLGDLRSGRSRVITGAELGNLMRSVGL